MIFKDILLFGAKLGASWRLPFFPERLLEKCADYLVRLRLPVSYLLFSLIIDCNSSAFGLNGLAKSIPVGSQKPDSGFSINEFQLTLSGTPVSCFGKNDGSIVSTLSGSSGGTVNFTLTPGSISNTTGTFIGLAAGTYTVQAEDGGILASASFTLNEPSTALSVAVTSNSPVCTSSILTLNANSAGGTGPYTYSWIGPNSFASTNQSPIILNPTAANAGNYTVTLKDANNCTATNFINVSVTKAPVVTASATVNTICAGGTVTLGSTSDIPPPPTLPAPIFSTTNNSTGGATAAANWTSRNDGYSVNGSTFHSNNNSSFYLSDSRSQNGTKTETILKSQSYNTSGFSSLNLSFWHNYRNGGATNESAKVQVSTDGLIWTTVSTFSVTAGGCTAFVNENINLDSYIDKATLFFRFYYYSESRARYWAIDNISLTGTSTVGLPLISWSSNPAGFSSSLAIPPSVKPVVTTVYSVTYTDPKTGCSNTASTAVTVNPTPNVTIQPNYCAVPGHVQLTAKGGSSYTWTTGETTDVILTDIADTYGVSSTNSNGCTGSVFLPVSTELVTNGDFSGGNSGFSNAYTYTNAANGLFPEGYYAVGSNPTFFHSNFWGRDKTTNSGNFLIVNGIGSAGVVVWQETVSVMKNTNYYFSAWAISLNSVAPYANLQFNVNDSLVGTTAPLAARLADNNPPYDWQRFYGNWNSGNATTAVIQIVDLQTALGGNDFGLDDVSFGTLAPIPFTIAPTVNPTTTVCSGKTMYLKANITGGRAPITYSWTSTNGFTSALKEPIIPNVTVDYSGIYTLAVVDGYGCDPVVGTTTATILPSPNPMITSINGTSNVCPLSAERYWTVSQSNVSNHWSVSGGNIIGAATKDTVDVQWGVSGNGSISLLATNNINFCDSMVTKDIQIQDLVPPVIDCPGTLNLSGTDETALTGIPYSALETTITLSQLTGVGGNASDNCGLSSITYKDVKSGSNPMVVKRTFVATDVAGNKSNCDQIIQIADDAPPTFTVPLSYGFCVENLISASIVSSSLQISPAPDYYLFKRGSTVLDLNPATFQDDYTPIDQLVLHWTIDFDPAAPIPSISGTGEPSAYTADIIFPGDGSTFANVKHKITYWLVDLTGNESTHKSVTINILPRPLISFNNCRDIIRYSLNMMPYASNEL